MKVSTARDGQQPCDRKKRRRRQSPKQIVPKLRDASAMLKAGEYEAAMLQSLDVTPATDDRWQKRNGGMKADVARRLREPEDEK
jgi:putative transposase